MKRLWPVSLALILLVILCLPVSVPADEEKLYTCGDFEYRILEDGTAEICEYQNWKTEAVEIPGSLDGLAVTSIGNMAFSFHSQLASVSVPDSVTSIGNGAFTACIRLTAITMPDSVTSIGYSAFSGCSILQSISIPSSVTSIGDVAFAWCDELSAITIPNSVTSIGSNPFSCCKKLELVTVQPDHPALYTIDGVLFSKADQRLVWYPIPRKDTVYEIPRGTQAIGNDAFSNEENQSSVSLPESITSIGDWAFSYCKNLESISIPDNITSIGDWAFSHCENLESIFIPNSVTSIGINPFENCESLKQVIVQPDHPAMYTLDGVLFSKADQRLVWYPISRSDSSYSVPQGVRIIGESSFSACKNLNSIILPNTVTNIEPYAFTSCTDLARITIPDSVTSIGGWAFDCCDNLISVIVSPGSRAEEYCEEYSLPFSYK